MPDPTPTPPSLPATPAINPNQTPPQPPLPTPTPPSDISTAFLSSLTKAMENESKGVALPPIVHPTMEDKPVDYSAKTGNLGQIVRSLVKDQEAKDKLAAATPPVVTPAPEVVPPVAAAPAVPPVVPAPAATPEVKPARNPEVDQFKLTPIPQTPAPAPTQSLTPMSLDLTGLNEDEVAEMQTAIFAEQKHPSQYRGHAQRMLNYIKEHKRVVSELEGSGESDIEDSARYKAFQKANKPSVTATERRRLEQERISFQAAQEAKAELSKELDEMRKQLAETRAAPAIERSLGEFRRVVDAILPKEDDPLVTQITNAFADTAVKAADQFIRLSNKQISYDPANPLHKGVADFIEDQASQFIKSGDAGLKRGGQSFISRAQYNTMPADQRAKHFTFTDDDVLRILAVNAKMNTEQAISRERKRLEDAGYVRKSSAPIVAPPPSPAQVVLDPSPRSGVAPGNAQPVASSRPADPFHSFLFAKEVTK